MFPFVNRTERTRTGRPHPIVAVLRDQGRTQSWLARRIGRSHEHTNRVLNGLHPATDAFRLDCAALLGLPEEALFLDHGAPSEPISADSITRDGTAAGQTYATEEAPSLGIPA